MTVNANYVQAGGYAASLDREQSGALLAKGAAGGVSRTGILPATAADLDVTALSTPNMSVNVAAGVMAIADAGFGAYIWSNTATYNQAVTASDPTNNRIDLIIARVYDNEVGDTAPTTSLSLAGGGTATVQTYTGKIEIVTGTPSFTPAVPALPNSRCAILKQITVRAGSASVVAGDLANTGRVGYTAAHGGLLPVPSQAVRDALPLYDGRHVYRQDTNTVEIYNGAAWAGGCAGARAKMRAGTSGQSIGNAAWTGVTLGTNDIDSHAGISGSTYVVKIAGDYLCAGSVQWAAPGAAGWGTRRGAGVGKNGTIIAESQGLQPPISNTGLAMVSPTSTQIYTFAAGDVISLMCYQDNGTTSTLGAQSALSVTQVG